MGEVTPVPETCNTVIDDDCNGQTNEGGAGCVCVPNSTATCYDGPNGTQGVGICQAGTQICNDQGTAYLPGCGGEVVPGVETCVGAADENCDGSACGVAQWAKIWGDAPGSQNSKDVATDSGGNVYIVGQFTGAIQFGASALISAGALDVFVAKFDSSGNHLWSKKFGDAANQNASAIAVSTTGDVLVTGYFQGAIDFGGGNLTTAGGSDVFVAKLDTNGNHVWSKRYGDASSQQAFDVGLDSSGNAIVVGIYYGTPNFGAGAFPGPVAGDQGVFWMKLAAATGNTTWAKPFVGGFHTARAVAVDPSGNIIIGGSFSSSLSIGCGSFTASSGEDAFVAKLDANGNCSWFKPFGTTNPQYTFDVAVDSSGGVVAAGNFQTSIAPGGIPLNAVGGFDYWIAKFSTGGTHLWSKAFGSAGGEDPGGLAIASNGDVWLAGTFDQTINLGGALLTSAGSVDVFVGRLDANGNHLWSARYGDSQIQQPGDVALAPSQDLYVTGLTTGAIDFGTGALVSAGGQDAYLAKIGH